MRHRTAKKIVKRVEADPAAALNYSLRQLQQAGRLTGLIEGEDVSERFFRVLVEREKAQARMQVQKQRMRDQLAAKRVVEVPVTVLVDKPQPDPEPPELDAEQIAKVAEAMDELPKLKAMKVPELKVLCKERGVSGYSKLNKEGLINALLPG